MKIDNIISAICISLMLEQAPIRAADASATRKKELAAVLVPMQKPGSQSEYYQENPGYYNPANRQALKRFISKYPGSEEALHAEVWLAYSEGVTQMTRDPVEKRRVRVARAQRMKEIIAETTEPRTAKIASLVRAAELFNTENWSDFERQVSEILARIKEYESEKDEQFLGFTKVYEVPPSEIEPFLRRWLIVKECYENHFDKALAEAEGLKQKFPAWSKREHIDNAISLLKQGEFPYRKL